MWILSVCRVMEGICWFRKCYFCTFVSIPSTVVDIFVFLFSNCHTERWHPHSSYSQHWPDWSVWWFWWFSLQWFRLCNAGRSLRVFLIYQCCYSALWDVWFPLINHWMLPSSVSQLNQTTTMFWFLEMLPK